MHLYIKHPVLTHKEYNIEIQEVQPPQIMEPPQSTCTPAESGEDGCVVYVEDYMGVEEVLTQVRPRMVGLGWGPLPYLSPLCFQTLWPIHESLELQDGETTHGCKHMAGTQQKIFFGNRLLNITRFLEYMFLRANIPMVNTT